MRNRNMGLGSGHDNIPLYFCLTGRDLRSLPNRRRCLLLVSQTFPSLTRAALTTKKVRNIITKRIRANSIMDHRMAYSRRKLDRNDEYQL
jgi:hypothetical protein